MYVLSIKVAHMKKNLENLFNDPRMFKVKGMEIEKRCIYGLK